MAKQVDITYGNALFELALEENRIDALYEEVQALMELLKENMDLIKILEHPRIDKDEKKKIVEDTFGNRVSDEITGLMVMVVEKEHIGNILDILNYFIKLVKKQKNIGVASVTSAIDLSDSQKAHSHENADLCEDGYDGENTGPDHKLGGQLLIGSHISRHHRAGHRHRRAEHSNQRRILIDTAG